MLDRSRPLTSPSLESLISARSLALRPAATPLPSLVETPPGEALLSLDQLVRKRLDLVQGGLREARRQIRAGNGEDAAILVEKLEEDLHLLQRRVRSAAETAPATSCLPR